jgi:hypothetical protein
LAALNSPAAAMSFSSMTWHSATRVDSPKTMLLFKRRKSAVFLWRSIYLGTSSPFWGLTIAGLAVKEIYSSSIWLTWVYNESVTKAAGLVPISTALGLFTSSDFWLVTPLVDFLFS